MEVELRSHVAFHLTGRRVDAGLDAVEPLALRPALLARYRDLTTLRYDYPVVLVENAAGDAYVQALSGIVDGILRELAQAEDGERVTRHVLRLERQIRTLVAQSAEGSLSALWEDAAAARHARRRIAAGQPRPRPRCAEGRRRVARLRRNTSSSMRGALYRSRRRAAFSTTCAG